MKVLKAIGAFLRNERDLSLKYVEEFNVSNLELSADLNQNDKVFCSAYAIFLASLLKEPRSNSPAANSHQTYLSFRGKPLLELRA